MPFSLVNLKNKLKGRIKLNFTYKHVRAEILSVLENVENATIYYPDYDVEPVSIVGQLQGLKLSIQSTNYHKVIQQVLGREYLPWEVVLGVNVGRRVRSLTITHIVCPYPKDVIDEFCIRGEKDGVKDASLYLSVHGHGKVTVRDFDVENLDGCNKPKVVNGEYFEDLVTTEDVCCILYNVFMRYLWGVTEDIKERETTFEKTQNRYISAVDV